MANMWATVDRLEHNPPVTFLSHLKGVAEFLNYDIAAGNEDQLRSIKQRLEIWARVLLDEALKKPNELMACQAELKDDLIPVLAPEKQLSPVEAEKRLKTLLKKINDVEDREREVRSWQFEMADYEWQEVWTRGADEPDYELLEKSPEDRGWGHGSQLALMGYDFFLTIQGLVKGNSLRDLLYLTISDALYNNSFGRLRVCQLPSCHRFFVAADNREKFCSPDHRNEFNNKQRLASTYYQDRRKKARKKALATARRLLRDGKSPKEIQKATKLSLRVLRKEKVLR